MEETTECPPPRSITFARQTARLPPYVGNLNFETTEADLRDLFAPCGVTEVRLMTSRPDNRPRGYGYAEFKTLDGLKQALDLSGTQFAGRNIRVSVAEPPREADDRTAARVASYGSFSSY